MSFMKIEESNERYAMPYVMASSGKRQLSRPPLNHSAAQGISASQLAPALSLLPAVCTLQCNGAPTETVL